MPGREQRPCPERRTERSAADCPRSAGTEPVPPYLVSPARPRYRTSPEAVRSSRRLVKAAKDGRYDASPDRRFGHSHFPNLKQEDGGSQRLSADFRVLEVFGVQCRHRVLEGGKVGFENPARFSGLGSWTHE
jgi:hypothetical protein